MASAKSTANAVQDIQRDMQALREDLSTLMQQISGMVGDGGDEAAGVLKEQIRRMQRRVDEVASGATERGIEAINGISERVSDGLEDAFHKHPVSTVAIAAGLGYLFGAVTARR
jgi:ElaB/YqjD/DUF883 family membrane-anchored ribosome-binding protein